MLPLVITSKKIEGPLLGSLYPGFPRKGTVQPRQEGNPKAERRIIMPISRPKHPFSMPMGFPPLEDMHNESSCVSGSLYQCPCLVKGKGKILRTDGGKVKAARVGRRAASVAWITLVVVIPKKLPSHLQLGLLDKRPNWPHSQYWRSFPLNPCLFFVSASCASLRFDGFLIAK